MAIVKMTRFHLTTFLSDREQILKALQQLGDVHFSDRIISKASVLDESDLDETSLLLQKEDKKKVTPNFISGVQSDFVLDEYLSVTEDLKVVEDITKLLLNYLPKNKKSSSFNTALPVISYRECEDKRSNLNLIPTIKHIQEIKKQKSDYQDAIAHKKEQNRTLRKYEQLDISFDQLNQTKQCELFVGYYPKRWRQLFDRAIEQLDLTQVEVLSADEKYMYIFVVSERSNWQVLQEILREHSFTKEILDGKGTPLEQIKTNEADISSYKEKIKKIEEQLTVLAIDYLDQFKLMYESLNNELIRLEAKERFLKTNHMVLIEGYVPVTAVEQLKEVIHQVAKTTYDLETTFVQMNDEDVLDVPVKLENNAIVQPFESIVSTYSMPRYNEVDPTPLMMPWFAISFGMMVGDLGYGFIIFLCSLLGLVALKLKKSTRNFLKFFMVLSIPTMIVGICFGSVFTVSFPSLIDPTVQYMPMLYLSVGFGFLMLMMGLGVKAYMLIRDKKPLAAVYDVLFWYMAIGGGIMMLLAGMLNMPAIVSTISTVSMIVGLVGILLFSARAEKGITPRLLWGLYNVYGMTSWIGDFVSYTRIAALTLSSTFIGYSINLIARGMFGSISTILPAILILIIFHSFNIFLSGLSGYVHTMRLVYVEYFGKFFEGGGIPFKRFRAESVYMEIE